MNGMERKAFEEIFLRWKDIVFREAYRWCGNEWDAEDVTQEVFLRLWRWGKIPENPGVFLLRITRNLCVDRHRKKEGYPQPEPEKRKDDIMDLLSALSSLPEKERLCIELRYVEGLSIKEIGRILSIPEGTVKTHIFRGKKRLKKVLEDRWRISGK